MGQQRKDIARDPMTGLPIQENSTILSAKVPTEIKDAVGSFAALNNVSMARVIIDAIVKYIGFDVSKLPVRQRKIIKYASDEERKEDYARKKKEERLLVQQLMDKYARNKKLAEADLMEKSLELQRIQNKKGQ